MRASTSVLAGLALALAAGCAARAALEPGIGEVAYRGGALEVELEARPHELARAAQAALGARELPVLWLSWSRTWGRVESRTPDGRPIRIAIRSAEEGRSHLELRLGSQGEDEAGRALLEDIRGRL